MKGSNAKEDDFMKRMKSLLSWLIVFAMIISLVPASPVRAEGEEGYNVYLEEEYVILAGTAPYQSYAGDDTSMEKYFDISVPEQEGVTDLGEGHWNVTGSFTFYVTIPTECNVEYLALTNYSERMTDVEFVATETENQYSVTVTPSADMSLMVCDDTYCSIYVEQAITNFIYYVTGIDSDEQVSCYKRGESYKFYVESISESANIDDLTFTVDGTEAELTEESAGVWSYTINNLTSEYNIKMYETGTKFWVNLPDVYDYGYEIYDANGANKIDHNRDEDPDNTCYGYEVEQGGDLTFQVKQTSGTVEYGMYIDGEELAATEVEEGLRSFTISNVTWNTNVSFDAKYLVSIDNDNVKMIPCTETGEALISEGVSEYYFRSYASAYFKLDAGDVRYQITSGDNIITPDENGVYSLFIEEASVPLTVAPAYRITLADTDVYSIRTDDTIIYEGGWNEEDNNYQYYVVGSFPFEIVVGSDYNVDNMKVYLKYDDGNKEELTSTGSTEEDGNTIYTFETGVLSGNVEIVVEGIYSIVLSNLVLHYVEDDMNEAGISVKVLDAEESELLLNEWDVNAVYAEVYSGLQYTLALSGTEAALSNLKVAADGEVLTGTISDGVWKADITNVSRIDIANGEQYFVSSDCLDDEVGNITAVEYGTKYTTELKGYYPNGNLSFWIQEDNPNVTAENAYVSSIKDSNGDDVTYTTQDNVEVDDYGTTRTVYTVNLTSDITIKIAGAEYREYDAYLPTPGTEDGYIISDLYTTSWEWDDELGEDVEVQDYLSGTVDTTNGCTKYPSITAGTEVRFDITTATDNGTPFVQINTTYDGRVWTNALYPNGNTVIDDSTMKYTYSFYVDGMSDIDISVNTEMIQVETITADSETNYYVLYNPDGMVWKIYDEDPEATAEYINPVLEIYDLPEIIDLNDTERQYEISYSIYDDSLMVDDDNADKFFTAKKADDTEQNLSMNISESGLYYEMPIKDGYYTLTVNMDLLELKNGEVALESYRDDMSVVILGEEGTDYEIVEDRENTYQTINQTLTFSVTAEDASAFEAEDFFLGMSGYTWDGTYMESEDGKTRTYTVTNVIWDGEIWVSYPATVEFEDCANGAIYTTAMGEGGGWDENDNFQTGTFAAGSQLGLNFYVNEGYDIDSVYVVQKYTDVEGNEQTIQYTDFEDFAWQNDRTCIVILQSGVNSFSITQPKKKTYTVGLPSSVAYSIELVNGSNTSVEYEGTFSFKVNAKDGYDLSSIIVSANGQKMTPDTKGIYTIQNISEDYEIAIAGFKTSKYVVTFKDYDGKVLKTQTVDHGNAATAPTNPTRDGYTFAGWDTTFTKITKDTTVTATYNPIKVTKLKITGDYKNLAVGKTMKLKATATPANALNTDVVWTTSNKKYATVSATGKVKALRKGAGKTVKITATAKDGSGVKATYKIKIYKNAVKKIKLSAKTKTVKAGKKVTIKAKFTPSKSICKTLKWTTSNKKWATVNSKGVVTTKKAGKGKTVKITAKAMDGSNKKAIIKIKIKK